jgi:hypothetical protein
MESGYHIVTIYVNETSWAHVWRLRSHYLGTGYDTLVGRTSPLHTRWLFGYASVEVFIHVSLCDRAGQIGESGALGREGWGAAGGYSEAPRWYPLPASIKDGVILAPVSKFSIVPTACRVLWGPVN